MLVKRGLRAAGMLTLAACSSTTTVRPDAGTSDATADVTIEASASDASGEAGCTEIGAVACIDVLTAYCKRVNECCVTGGVCFGCTGWGCDQTMSACKVAYAEAGLDCDGGRFARTSCVAETAACLDDLDAGLPSCTKIEPDPSAVTAGWSSSCNTFWAQFP